MTILLVTLPACSLIQPRAALDEPAGLIAVMPIERDATASASTMQHDSGGVPLLADSPDEKPTGRAGLAARPVAGDRRGIAPGAEQVITAQIYGVLSGAPRWRFVPDLKVSQALANADVAGEQSLRARWLGQQVSADTVLFGTVSRYVERVGAAYGAQQPAAVAIELQLLSVSSGTILWRGSFDQEQQSLSSNLFHWWQFWKGGPKWFSAPEFARIAVERLLDDLAKRSD